MPRVARVEALGFGHHILQRGNRSQQVFFSPADKKSYLKILKIHAELYRLDIWAYCLMDNHVHLIAVPQEPGSLTKGIGETHRMYTRMINFRKKWRGYLWQGRFKSFPMDSSYLYHCVRYVERNPVRAGIVSKAEDYLFSSARAHIYRETDGILTPFYLSEDIRNWRHYLEEPDEDERVATLRAHVLTGRPLGEEKFIDDLEEETGRILKRRKPGPPQK